VRGGSLAGFPPRCSRSDIASGPPASETGFVAAAEAHQSHRGVRIGPYLGRWQGSHLAARGFHLPADVGWPNTGHYGLSPRPLDRRSMLSLYARECGHLERLAKGLKAHKTMFPRGLRSTKTAGLWFAAGLLESAEVGAALPSRKAALRRFLWCIAVENPL